MSSSIGGFANSEKLVFTLFLKDLAAYCSVSSLRVLNVSNAGKLEGIEDPAGSGLFALSCLFLSAGEEFVSLL